MLVSSLLVFSDKRTSRNSCGNGVCILSLMYYTWYWLSFLPEVFDIYSGLCVSEATVVSVTPSYKFMSNFLMLCVNTFSELLSFSV